MKQLLIIFAISLLAFNAQAQEQPADVRDSLAIDSPDSLLQSAHIARSGLIASVKATATTIHVASTAVFPSIGALVIDTEVIFYKSKTATSFNDLTRGADGSAVATHARGAEVRGVILAARHNTLSDVMIAPQAKVGTKTPATNTILKSTGVANMGRTLTSENTNANGVSVADFRTRNRARARFNNKGLFGIDASNPTAYLDFGRESNLTSVMQRFRNRETGSGDFAINLSNGVNSNAPRDGRHAGRQDNVLSYVAYNATTAGKQVEGEHSLFFNLESRYTRGDGVTQAEWYQAYVPRDSNSQYRWMETAIDLDTNYIEVGYGADTYRFSNRDKTNNFLNFVAPPTGQAELQLNGTRINHIGNGAFIRQGTFPVIGIENPATGRGLLFSGSTIARIFNAQSATENTRDLILEFGVGTNNGVTPAIRWNVGAQRFEYKRRNGAFVSFDDPNVTADESGQITLGATPGASVTTSGAILSGGLIFDRSKLVESDYTVVVSEYNVIVARGGTTITLPDINAYNNSTHQPTVRVIREGGTGDVIILGAYNSPYTLSADGDIMIFQGVFGSNYRKVNLK